MTLLWLILADFAALAFGFWTAWLARPKDTK
jgi:hypothetical protein